MKIDFIEGVKAVIHPLYADNRGSFQRIYDLHLDLPEQQGFVQSSLSRNFLKGTIRGLHFQEHPSREAKYITCTQGRIYDVLVDVRENSVTYGRYVEFELTPESGISVFAPPGIAHGFQTLEDHSAVLYQMTEQHMPSAARRLLWSDPLLGISWPLQVSIISDLDKRAEKWPVKY